MARKNHLAFLWRNKKWRWLIIAIIVIGMPLVINTLTPVPTARVLRILIGWHGGMRPPPDFSTAEQSVSVTKAVPLTSSQAPTSHIDIYQPKNLPGVHPIILWIHGGGYVGGTAADTRVYMTLLAREGYVAASLDFTRPPDARYPVPIRQGNAALRYLVQHAAQYGGDAKRVFVAGNSSGAQIASQLAATETDPALAAAMHLSPALSPGSLRGAVLNSGVYDISTLDKVHFPFLNTFLWVYTGHRNWMKFPDIAQLSTTAHVTAAYPPVFLTAGDADPMEPQAFEFEAVLLKKHVPVTTQLWNGSGARLPHDYQFEFNRPEARQTFQQTLHFLHSQSASN